MVLTLKLMITMTILMMNSVKSQLLSFLLKSKIVTILIFSSPSPINPYETTYIKIVSTESEDPTYMKTVSSDSDVEDPYYSIPADELEVN